MRVRAERSEESTAQGRLREGSTTVDSSPDRPSGTENSSGHPPLDQSAAFGLRMTWWIILFLLTGCASIFGWDIHAPGLLSEGFTQSIQPAHQRIALYFPKDILNYVSKNRGGKTADPQTYHIGEAYGPMLIEAFQSGFDEFIFLEVEPSANLLKQYAIPYLVIVRIKDFQNEVSWSGQGLSITTETAIFDTSFNLMEQFESKGSSDVKRVFSKKGGPQVNLNLAIENNIMSIIEHIQDTIKQRSNEN